MATSLQQHKLDLMANILGIEDLNKVKEIAAFVEDLENPKRDERLSLDELLRQGEEDIAAGRISTWEETKKAALQAIKEGGEEYRRRNGQTA
jgi:hypothetical protein